MQQDHRRHLNQLHLHQVPTVYVMQIQAAHTHTKKKNKSKNKTRNNIEPVIYVAAAKLQENHGNLDGEKQMNRINSIISRAIERLQIGGVVIDRDSWLQEAAKCENAGCPLTCQAIVKEVIELGVEKQDRLKVWSQEAKDWEKQGQIEVARSIYSYMLNAHPEVAAIWFEAAKLEKHHGKQPNGKDCEAILRKAVTFCRQSIQLWLFLGKTKWRVQKDLHGSRAVLQEALNSNPKSERIWLARVQLEIENGDLNEARKVLQKAKDEGCASPKVYVKAAWLERNFIQFYKIKEEKKKILREIKKQKETKDNSKKMDTDENKSDDNDKNDDDDEFTEEEYDSITSVREDFTNEILLLDEGIQKYPGYDKLWLMRIQASERSKDYLKCRKLCREATNQCSHSVNLWCEYARIELSQNRVSKARSVLETARNFIPNNDMLWFKTAELEFKHASLNVCKSKLAQGLQECPGSGLLWAFSIEIEPFASRKSICVQAIKACPNDAYVFTAVAIFFWHRRKIKPATDWFERAIASKPDYGDGWAHYLKFLKEYGSIQQQNDIRDRCSDAKPKYGLLWQQVSKKIGNDLKETKQILEIVCDKFCQFQTN